MNNNNNNNNRGVFGWLARQFNTAFKRVLKKAFVPFRNIDKSKVRKDTYYDENNLNVRGSRRGTGSGKGTSPVSGRGRKGKVNGYEDTYKESGKDSYIDDVDSFSKEESSNYKPVYQYGQPKGDVELEGTSVDDKESSDDYGDSVDEKDLWEKEESEGVKDYYKERLEEIKNENSDSSNDILKFYAGLAAHKGDATVDEKDKIRKQVYRSLAFSKAEQAPYFLTKMAELEANLKSTVHTSLSEEVKNKFIEEELKRYRDIIQEFMDVKETDGKYFITDWKLGVKVVDFMLKKGDFPEIFLLLSPNNMDEIVKVMRTGYLPEYLKETPFEKVMVVFENLAERIEKEKGSPKYSFPAAYKEYKRQLPMYIKLRNNGKLANVNKVLGYFYSAVDSLEVSHAVEGDAYFGLIEPDKFISQYVKFFYGKAKQTNAMSEVVLKLSKKDPTILLEVEENDGYALGDTPEGSILVIAGHVVALVHVGKGKYSQVIDKAPSDITTEDISNITGMFSNDRKKRKQAKSKVKKKTVTPVKTSKGLSYDYDKALKEIKAKK